jgi:hypothetical protein
VSLVPSLHLYRLHPGVVSTRIPERIPKYDKKDLQIQALQKKATRLERELDIAKKLLELQKKASELLGIELASPEEP